MTLKNLAMKLLGEILIRAKNYCTLKLQGDALPEIPPWFGDEADIFEELPASDDTAYQFR